MTVSATKPGWRKWRACDPTSAHWYDAERFGRYIAAHIAHDEDRGHPGRTVREFIAELRGLTRSDKQKAVLAEVGASGVSLSVFFRESNVNALLTACKNATKPVKPEELGLIGAGPLLEHCTAVGAAEESFEYRKQLGLTSGGLPYAVEVAFAYCPDNRTRRLVTGVNFSVGIRNPFQQLGPFESLSSLLVEKSSGPDEELWPEVGDGLTDKAAYRGGVQRLHFSNEGGIRRVRQ